MSFFSADGRAPRIWAGRGSLVLTLSLLAGCSPQVRIFETTAGTGGHGGSAPTTSSVTATGTGGQSSSSTGGSSHAGSGGQGGGGHGGSGGAAVCPATSVCAVALPAGWSGPVAVAAGSPPPDCPSTYPDVALDLKDDVTFDPTECQCNCGPPTIDCGPLYILWRQGCGQPITADPVAVGPNQCATMTPKQSGMFGYFTETVQSPCAPLSVVSTPEPVFDTSVRACGGAVDHGGCADTEVCLPRPEPPFTDLCVFKEGDNPCPPGYLDKSVHYAGVNDTRECTACTCDAPTNVQCSSLIHPFSDTLCAVPVNAPFPTDTTCSGSESHLTYETPTITGACAAEPVAPTGTLELTDPYTICCSQ